MNCHNISEAKFDRWLEEALGQELDLDPRIVAMAREKAIRRSLSLRSPKGASLMKKTIWTTAAAIAAAATLVTVLAPRAEASSPKTKFAAVKKAILAKQAKTNISLTISAPGSNGKVESVAFVNGQRVEIQPGVPLSILDGQGSILIDPQNMDLSSLSAEERAQIEKMIHAALANGGTTSSVSSEFYINGEKVSAEEAQKIMKNLGMGFDVTTMPNGDVKFELSFDFDEASYSAMEFGQNENVLLLTPKKGKNTRYALTVDPKTNLPTKMTLQSSKGGKWVDVRNSSFQYRLKKKAS